MPKRKYNSSEEAKQSERMLNNAARKRYYERHKDRVSVSAQKWRAKNSERVKELNRKSHERNKEKRLADAREWKRENSHHVKLYMKEWKQKNQEHIKEYRKNYAVDYYQKNKEQIKANVRRYYQKNRENISAYNRMRYIKNRTQRIIYTREWGKNNPDKVREQSERKRARKINAPINDFTIAQWKEILAIFKHKCAYCGKYFKRLEQDHVIPLSKGGSHTASNIVPSCKPCNSSKNAKPPPIPVQTIMLTLAPPREIQNQ